MPAKKKSKKTNRLPLSKELILSVALDLADKEGLENLSMRNLGKRLGVEAMSLYKHIANKEELFDGLVDLVISEITLPSIDLDWIEFMKIRAKSARKVFLRHPWSPAIFESRMKFSVVRLNYANQIIGVLRKNGFNISMATHAFTVIDSYIYGFVLQELNWRFEDGENQNSYLDGSGNILLNEFPYVIELMEQIQKLAIKKGKKTSFDLESEFEFGLNLILKAIQKN